MNRKDEIIHMLGEMSPTKFHEYVAEMLDYYNVFGTMEITEEQAEAFLRRKEEEINAKETETADRI